MPQAVAEAEPRATRAVRGTLHRFLPLPVMRQHAQWFAAGPVTFALELRVLDDGNGNPGERSISIHVFTADRSRECVRFDCFDAFPHYHYVLNDTAENIVWGYDPEANGPMVDWSFRSIRERLPAFLRQAREPELAGAVEREGLDHAAIDALRAAIDSWEPSLPSADATAEAKDWYVRWKAEHPQFNTAAGQRFL
ncbi:MAG: hypothetical protein KGN34_17905 [Sphingomonadales bacterium]|nr:hypothetical protein [Sphingomonadales bacterium]